MNSSQSTKVAAYFDRIAGDFDSYYEKPHSGFQEFTNRYLRKPSLLKRLKITLQALEKPTVQSVLDIGCGSGVLVVPLAQRGKKVLGIDFSAEMIELAKQKTKEAGVAVQFRVADFMEDDFPPVDACTALGVLEYFKDANGMIDKMLNLTSSGGLVIFDLPSLLNVHTPLRLPYLLWRRAKAYFYTPWGIRRLLAPFQEDLAGYRLEKYGAGYVLILEKK